MGKNTPWAKLTLKRVVKQVRSTLQPNAAAQKHLDQILKDLADDDAAAALKRATTQRKLNPTYKPLQETLATLERLSHWMNHPVDEPLWPHTTTASVPETPTHEITIYPEEFTVPTVENFTGSQPPHADVAITLNHLQEQISARGNAAIRVQLSGQPTLACGLVALAAVKVARQRGVNAVLEFTADHKRYLHHGGIVGQILRRCMMTACAEADAVVLQQNQQQQAQELFQVPPLHPDAQRVTEKHTARGKAAETTNLKKFLKYGELVLQSHPAVPLGLPPDFDEDPFEEHNWRFNFHSLRWADPLRKLYLQSGQEKYKQQHLAIVKRWIRSRGDSTNRFIPTQIWTDMSTALRCRNLIAVVTTYGPDPEVMMSLHHHLEWLKNPENWPGRGNHLLHVYRGLLDLALALGDEETHQRAVALIFEFIRDAVSPAGEDLEGAYMYQRLNQTWMKEALDDVRVTDQIPEDLDERVNRMANLATYARDHGGHAVQYGDSNAVTGKPVQLGQKLPAPEPDHATIQALRIYPVAGMAFLRTESETNPTRGTFAALRIYPKGTRQIHAHNDHGNVFLSFGKHQILRDSGRYVYGGGSKSHYLRSPLAHSVATQLGASVQDAVLKGRFTWSQDTASYKAVSCSAVVGPDTTWYRTVVVHHSGEMDVYDYWESTSVERFQIFWQVADFEVQQSSSTGCVLVKEGVPDVKISVNVPIPELLVQRGEEGAGQETFVGFRSDKYKEFVPATRLCMKNVPANTLIKTTFSS